jgi:hypothetical protein
MATFQRFFSAQGTGGSPTGTDPENRVGEFPSALCLTGKKLDVSSRLDVAEIALVA